jgi:hypothetical protein
VPRAPRQPHTPQARRPSRASARTERRSPAARARPTNSALETQHRSSLTLPSRRVPDRRDQSHQLGQHLDAQRPLGRLRPPVGRVLQDPDRSHWALTHVEPHAAQAALVQDRQPLPTQRVKRMRYDQRVTTSVDSTRTMRMPSTRSVGSAGTTTSPSSPTTSAGRSCGAPRATTRRRRIGSSGSSARAARTRSR